MKPIRSGPYSVRIDLTRRCNLACAHCLANASSATEGDELSAMEWIRFFDRLRELHVFRVSVSGGEPLVRADALELLRALASRGFTVSLMTNGTLITEQVATEFAAMRLTNVCVALDGLHRSHDALRGKGSFDRAVAGVRHLVQHGIRPVVNFVPMRHNVADLGGVIDLAVECGVERIAVNTLRPEGRCEITYARLAPRFPDDLRVVKETLAAKQAQYPATRLSCYATFYYDLAVSSAAKESGSTRTAAAAEADGERQPNQREPNRLMAGCSACRGSCHVTSIGDVLPCVGLDTFLGGNIRTTDLLEIWRESPKFKEIVALGEHPVTAVPECASCEFAHWCNGGCRADALRVFGTLLAPDPLCPHWAASDKGAHSARNTAGQVAS